MNEASKEELHMPDALARSFRDLLAADQAREALRREAALYVLLCLDDSTERHPPSSH